MKDERQRMAGRINVMGWLMSYADMATVLLAMFIVLSTLSKDQTGISLYNGTRSFFRVTQSFGLPGESPNAGLAENKPTPSYLYQPGTAEGEDQERFRTDQPAVLDSDEQRLHHFLGELRRQFPVENKHGQAGRVVIDTYEPLGKEAPYLRGRNDELFAQLRPLLEREDHRLYLIVWATTPSSSAWLRAAGQARQAADELAARVHLPPAAAARLIPLGQPWRYRDVRRPVLSFLVVKAGT